jgi:ABC-2 type transport system ATP-binding protein
LGGGPKEASPLAQKMSHFPNESNNVIDANALSKKFGNFVAVDNVSFSVKRGEIFGLLGPNGAGKSTTFRILCGLTEPDKGKASVNGVSLQEASDAVRGKIGYVAQKFSLYANLSVKQNLTFFSGIYPVKNTMRKAAIDMMIEIFAFKQFLNTPAGELPLGYKQRLALACALMHRPEVLFLDEATSGVDPVTRREFWNHINSLVQMGTTVMITTHYMDEAEYCDRIGFLSSGQLVALGSPDDLKRKVRSEALPNPTIEEAFVILSGGKIDV